MWKKGIKVSVVTVLDVEQYSEHLSLSLKKAKPKFF